MRVIEVGLPAAARLEPIPAQVEAVMARAGLRQTLRGRQASYPGSVHWHYHRGRERGTLELTFWPAQRRLWLKVGARRGAAWIDELLPRIQADLEQALAAPGL